jgi:hypothetical protein
LIFPPPPGLAMTYLSDCRAMTKGGLNSLNYIRRHSRRPQRACRSTCPARHLVAELTVNLPQGRNIWYRALIGTAFSLPDLGGHVMRLSSLSVAPSAVAIFSTALLCALTGTAVSQTARQAPATPIPSITVDAPKQVARPQKQVARPQGQAARPQRQVERQVEVARPQGSGRAANTVAPRPTSQPARTPAPGSTMAKLAALERTSSSCADGCTTSFKYGNQPWNGCSVSGADFGSSTTCRNVRNYKTYYECRDTTMFVGWRQNDAWWYCSSLLAGGKLAGEKWVEMRTLRY